MGVYFGATEIAGLYFGDTEITGLYFGDTEIWAAWAEYDGALPAQYTANGDYLADYRIYGANGGVGDRTENLCTPLIAGTYEPTGYETTYAGRACTTRPIFLDKGSITVSVSIGIIYLKKIENGVWVQTIAAALTSPATITIPSFGAYAIQINTAMTNQALREINRTIVAVQGSTAPASYVPYGYEVDMSVRSANLCPDTTILSSGYSVSITSNGLFDIFKNIKANVVYQLSWLYESNGTGGAADQIRLYDANAVPVKIINNGSTFSFTAEEITAFITISAYFGSTNTNGKMSNFMFAEGSTPLPYQPYSNITKPIYIGSSPLGEDEYIDYKSGKIYRMSESVLTPTDPPVPLPALPTIDGVNIVDYAGQSTAVPSRFVAKYRKEGF